MECIQKWADISQRTTCELCHTKYTFKKEMEIALHYGYFLSSMLGVLGGILTFFHFENFLYIFVTLGFIFANSLVALALALLKVRFQSIFLIFGLTFFGTSLPVQLFIMKFDFRILIVYTIHFLCGLLGVTIEHIQYISS